jgi:hypothetical protein
VLYRCSYCGSCYPASCSRERGYVSIETALVCTAPELFHARLAEGIPSCQDRYPHQYQTSSLSFYEVRVHGDGVTYIVLDKVVLGGQTRTWYMFVLSIVQKVVSMNIYHKSGWTYLHRSSAIFSSKHMLALDRHRTPSLPCALASSNQRGPSSPHMLTTRSAPPVCKSSHRGQHPNHTSCSCKPPRINYSYGACKTNRHARS